MHHENLWAPWRRAYLLELQRKADHEGVADDAGSSGSFLVEYFAHPEHDERNHVIHRDAHGMVLLNRYPYANGHLLVALGDARPGLLDYERAQRAAFWALVEHACGLMRRTLRPQGINMGINEGSAAGAGVPDHLHAHVIPRWSGDTNFISTVGGVRIIPDALEEMAKSYRLASDQQAP